LSGGTLGGDEADAAFLPIADRLMLDLVDLLHVARRNSPLASVKAPVSTTVSSAPVCPCNGSRQPGQPVK
jgi:hypothetical protein